MPTRAEHRRATLRRLGDAAVDLYESMAPAEPTVDHIASEAGVSRRTAFRYIESKEELLFTHPVLWFEIFDAAIAERADAPIGDRLRHASDAISRVIDADPEPVLRSFRVSRGVPGAAASYAVVNHRWIDRVEAEIARDSEGDRFRDRVLAAAVMGVIDAALEEWAGDEGATLLVDLVDRGLRLLSPLFADAGGQVGDAARG
ncbi:MAG: TetR family transcriptional regulator [Actinomycetota bacterium]